MIDLMGDPNSEATAQIDKMRDLSIGELEGVSGGGFASAGAGVGAAGAGAAQLNMCLDFYYACGFILS